MSVSYNNDCLSWLLHLTTWGCDLVLVMYVQGLCGSRQRPNTPHPNYVSTLQRSAWHSCSHWNLFSGYYITSLMFLWVLDFCFCFYLWKKASFMSIVITLMGGAYFWGDVFSHELCIVTVSHLSRLPFFLHTSDCWPRLLSGWSFDPTIGLSHLG